MLRVKRPKNREGGSSTIIGHEWLGKSDYSRKFRIDLIKKAKQKIAMQKDAHEIGMRKEKTEATEANKYNNTR